MNRHVIFSLSFCFLFCFLCECYAVERSTQKTTGDQSPAAQADRGATIKIEYNNIVNQYISETKTKFSECLDIATVFQNQKLADLNKTIATLLVQNEGASKGEADKWAKDLIEQAPGFKKERENNNALIRKYNEELSKNLLAKVYNTFTYIFETIDSKFLAIKELSPKSTYKRGDRFDLFSDETSQIKPYIARSFVLANGNRITITLTPGIIKNGLIQACPSLAFDEYAEHRLMQSFKINPHYGGATMTIIGGVQHKKEEVVADITYPATGADVLTEHFKEELNKAFTEFIKLAFTR